METNVYTTMHNAILGVMVALVATLMATGCTVYHPQAVDVPLINHRGDLRIDASASVSAMAMPDVFAVGATASYGINDWLAVQGHLNYGGENVYAQGAVGGYLPLGEKAVLEGYAGAGVGGVWRDATGHSYDGHFVVPFAQVNFGWHDLIKGHLDLGVGVKAGGFVPSIHYHAYDSDGVERLSDREHLTAGSLLLEPQLMLRVGGRHTKFCLRLGACRLPGLENIGSHLTYDWLTLSAGVTVSL